MLLTASHPAIKHTSFVGKYKQMTAVQESLVRWGVVVDVVVVKSMGLAAGLGTVSTITKCHFEGTVTTAKLEGSCRRRVLDVSTHTQ